MAIAGDAGGVSMFAVGGHKFVVVLVKRAGGGLTGRRRSQRKENGSGKEE